MNLGESLLVLRSPVLVVDSEFYLVVYNKYLVPQLKDTGLGGGLKDTRQMSIQLKDA